MIDLPEQLAYLKKAQWQVVNDGKSDALVYLIETVNSIQYLKVTDKTSRMPVYEDYKRLRWLQNKIPVPDIMDYAETGTHQFLLMSACAGLHPLHDDLAWEADKRTKLLAENAKQFHAIDAVDCPYHVSFDEQIAIARHNIDAKRIDLAYWEENRYPQTIEDGFAELVSLKPAEEDFVVTHGDMYPVNMRVDSNTGQLTGFIDVGRCAVADRYTDLALIVNAIGWHLDDDAIDNFFKHYGIVPDKQKLAFYRLLDFFLG
ncbi:MAG: APH(3') family aminoglycoside O-phosphotransferase [Chloroflexota bacterium]